MNDECEKCGEDALLDKPGVYWCRKYVKNVRRNSLLIQLRFFVLYIVEADSIIIKKLDH
jgi:hypothetical protein